MIIAVRAWSNLLRTLLDLIPPEHNDHFIMRKEKSFIPYKNKKGWCGFAPKFNALLCGGEGLRMFHDHCLCSPRSHIFINYLLKSKRDIKTHKMKSIDKSRNTGTWILHKYTGKPPAWNAEAILYKTTNVYTWTYIHWI